jgi:hypothetical protein
VPACSVPGLITVALQPRVPTSIPRIVVDICLFKIQAADSAKPELVEPVPYNLSTMLGNRPIKCKRFLNFACDRRNVRASWRPPGNPRRVVAEGKGMRPAVRVDHGDSGLSHPQRKWRHQFSRTEL